MLKLLNFIIKMRFTKIIKHLIRLNHIRAGRKPMRRTDIINHLILKNRYSRYLEIGIRTGNNFKKIIATYKDGVDPAANCHFPMTSDDFFQSIAGSGMRYDIIFIDGLHIETQVKKDVENSLNYLNTDGTIVLHDCNPTKESHQQEIITGSARNGTVWKAVAHFRITREDLSIYVVDTDHGCGIIRRGVQRKFQLDSDKTLDYQFLDKNRKKLLNLKTTKEFLHMI